MSFWGGSLLGPIQGSHRVLGSHVTDWGAPGAETGVSERKKGLWNGGSLVGLRVGLRVVFWEKIARTLRVIYVWESERDPFAGARGPLLSMSGRVYLDAPKVLTFQETD